MIDPATTQETRAPDIGIFHPKLVLPMLEKIWFPFPISDYPTTNCQYMVNTNLASQFSVTVKVKYSYKAYIYPVEYNAPAVIIREILTR